MRTFDGGVLPERTCVVNYDGFAEGMLLLSSFFSYTLFTILLVPPRSMLFDIAYLVDSVLFWCLYGRFLDINVWQLADVKVGDELVVDGGMVRFEVVEKFGPDAKCKCTDPGRLLPRANLTIWREGRLVRERNAMLPTISSKALIIPFFDEDQAVQSIINHK